MCLLYQKLQMLNCCIVKKLQRDRSEPDTKSEKTDASGEDSDEEFFDCDENVSDEEGTNIKAELKKPMGRLRKCGRLRLLKTGEPLYIPITQDPAPLTEDIVEEQAKQLVELGSHAEGSEQRAKMMSASLQSDMEAFKAANPGSILEDFVRWYSPRDWIETDEVDKFGNKTGSLSGRMTVPGNLWLEVWASSLPVPVRRQKRLFDDTKEAEKILHWLRTRSLRDVSQLLFPSLIHGAVVKVIDEVESFSSDYTIPPQLAQHTTQLSRAIQPEPPQKVGTSEFTDEANCNNYFLAVLSLIGKVEKEIAQMRSFQQKFPIIDVQLFRNNSKVAEGCNGDNGISEEDLVPTYIKVEGGSKSPVGEIIKDIFRLGALRSDANTIDSEIEFKFGEPVRKVFILKYCPTKCNSSSSFGHFNQEETLPHRMSCLVKNDEFLLAGTFTARTDVS